MCRNNLPLEYTLKVIPCQIGIYITIGIPIAVYHLIMCAVVCWSFLTTTLFHQILIHFG